MCENYHSETLLLSTLQFLSHRQTYTAIFGLGDLNSDAKVKVADKQKETATELKLLSRKSQI